MDIVRIINKRKPIPESDLRKAFEWKPWEARREEVPRKRPVPSSNDYEDHMKSQAGILEKAQETLHETKDEAFYRVHSDYIEEVYLELDEDNRVELKTFMLELYRHRTIQIGHKAEMQSKLENAKKFLKQSTEPGFFMKYSDFIDAVYAEFRSPGDAEYLTKFGKFLEGLWEERNPKPRIHVMRMKQKQSLPDQDSEEEEERKIEQTR